MLSRLSNVARMGAKATAKPMRPLTVHLKQQFLCTSTRLQEEEKWTAGQRDWAGLNEAYEDAVVVQEEPSLLQTYKDMAGDAAATILPVGLVYVLFGKEIIVLNEEMANGFLTIPVLYFLYLTAGPPMLAAYDAYKADFLSKLEQEKTNKIAEINSSKEYFQEMDDYYSVAPDINSARKANNEMSLEASHRLNLKEVETEVAKRLDYQIELQKLHVKIEHEHIAKWVENAVVSSITPKQEEDALLKCIADINQLVLAKQA